MTDDTEIKSIKLNGVDIYVKNSDDVKTLHIKTISNEEKDINHGAKEGDNTIVVCDIYDNCASYSFILDFTAPTIKTGGNDIMTGDIYNDKIKIKVSDDFGIGYLEKNTGLPREVMENGYYITSESLVSEKEGEHYIIVRDLAGNETKVEYSLYFLYSLSVKTNVEGTETLISNCGNSLKVNNSNILEVCNVFNPNMDRYTDFNNLYEGFKLVNWSVNGVEHETLDNVKVDGETVVIANYKRINNDTNLMLSLVDEYKISYLIFSETIKPAAGNKLLIIDVDGLADTEIKDATVYFADGTTEVITFNLKWHTNPIYYAEVSDKEIEKIEFEYTSKFDFDDISNCSLLDIKNCEFITEKTILAKFTYSFLENKFYYYGE